MKNKLLTFHSEIFGNLRGRYLNGECWFVGKDVALALGYKNVKRALQEHVFGDYKQILNAKTIAQMASQRKGTQNVPLWNKVAQMSPEQQETTSPRGMLYIREPGLYQLIFSSKMPKAIEFQRWIFEEVLPSIRRDGMWQQVRENGKAVRLHLTETIKDFLAYLQETNQLDRSPTAWYSAFSDLVSKAAKVDDKRDDLSIEQLFELDTCERIVARELEAGMAAGKGHHDIWLDCKAKLNQE